VSEGFGKREWRVLDVVGSYGLHHSVRGLWVADASTFPTCVGVNPQMTIMAFAKRTAERLVETCA
jgi:choline dehydrogenase-like flavoprotein